MKGGDIINNILIIEDDKALSDGICFVLKNQEISLSQCFDLKSSRNTLKQHNFDLLILDINLPDGNGLDFMCEIKKISNTPIILLTANDMETDIVIGLESGADDYLTKPFSLAVLRARVNTQLRKSASTSPRRIEIDCFIFDFENMEYYKLDERIELSKTEQKLLRLLIESRGNILSRTGLTDKIWTDGFEYVDENALSVTIKRLRDKLEDIPSKPQYIKTLYGIGYTWVKDVKPLPPMGLQGGDI